MKKIIYYFLALLFTICITSFSGCDNSVKYPPSGTETLSDNGSFSEKETDQKSKEDSIREAQKDSLEKVHANEVKEVQDKLSVQGDSINDLNTRIAKLEKKSNDSIDKSSAYTFMIFEFILLSLLIIYLYMKFRKLDNRTQKVELTFNELSQSGVSEFQIISIVNSEISNLAKQINTKNLSQDNRMDDIVKRLIKLEGPQDAYSQYRPEKIQDEQEPNHEAPRKTDVFYMPRTMTQMQFEDSKKKYSKDDTTYFKFTIKEKGKATFVFDPYDESYIGRAFDDRENSLLTVCELEIKNATPKKFENNDPGKAELRGNVWVVTKKLKLKYV